MNARAAQNLQNPRSERMDSQESFSVLGGSQRVVNISDRSGGKGSSVEAAVNLEAPRWRRVLMVLTVVGIPFFTCASTEFGQFMMTRLTGQRPRFFFRAPPHAALSRKFLRDFQSTQITLDPLL
jgi:hypothetical protein